MKKLGFGLMRLPVKSENQTDIDQAMLNLGRTVHPGTEML